MDHEIPFGKLIKDRRLAHGLTQAELAARVSCATITIRKIEANDRRPSVRIAEHIVQALNVPLVERDTFIRLARKPLMKTFSEH